MVMNSYTKQRVISLYSQGETASSIVDRLVLEDGVQVSKQGVLNLLKRYVRYRTICRRPGSGCPSKITPGIKQIIEDAMRRTTKQQPLKYRACWPHMVSTFLYLRSHVQGITWVGSIEAQRIVN